MFPPNRTSSPHELLNNLWSSVQRGGAFFSQDARVEQNDEGLYSCLLHYAPGGVPKEVRPALEKYMRGYARASGWTIKSLRFKRSHAVVELAASRAASSLSKKT